MGVDGAASLGLASGKAGCTSQPLKEAKIEVSQTTNPVVQYRDFFKQTISKSTRQPTASVFPYERVPDLCHLPSPSAESSPSLTVNGSLP